MSDMSAAQADYVAAATLEPRGLFWFCAGCCGLWRHTGGEYLGKALKGGYDEAESALATWQFGGVRIPLVPY